jgi:nitrate/nitrite-specific signal transduction histidine kinase
LTALRCWRDFTGGWRCFKRDAARRHTQDVKSDAHRARRISSYESAHHDGKGIDPELLREEGREGHFGLRGMRERAKLAGGKLTVWSGLDTGTEVELSIPALHAYSSALP